MRLDGGVVFYYLITAKLYESYVFNYLIFYSLIGKHILRFVLAMKVPCYNKSGQVNKLFYLMEIQVLSAIQIRF